MMRSLKGIVVLVAVVLAGVGELSSGADVWRNTSVRGSSALKVLSEHGCVRATAYSEFNKIITTGDKTHVSRLDSENGKFLVKIQTLERETGKKPSGKFHFPNMNENLFAYGVGSHRHMPEMEQIAGEIAGSDVRILFQPHAGPFDRGIASTVYCQPKGKISSEQLPKLYSDFYAAEPFVQICRDAPSIKDVAGTNYCHIFPTCVKGRIVVFSVIDNLVKGASGQAIQNMNIIFGIEETMGLK